MSVRSPLRLSRRITTSEPCVFCSFSTTYGQNTQRRSLADRRAPSTRLKQWRESTKILTPERKELLRLKQERDKLLVKIASESMTLDQRLRILGGNHILLAELKDKVVMFINDFRAREEQDDEDFQDVMNQFKLSLDDIYEATFALRNFGYPSQAKLGRDLLRACDRSGHAEATLQIASARLRQDIAQPGVLRVTEVLKTLDRLRKLSEQGNMRAVVLEGKLAARRGDEELAISHYERAMDAILENEKEGKDKTSGTRQKWDRRLDDELSSPWIELGFLYMQRKEMTKSLEAYMVGLNQDDPLAYYNLSVLDWHMSDGEPTLNWLFNVTKAAASGHFKAAFELGRYYADSPPHPPPPEDELENSDESMSPETDEEGVSEQPDTDDQRTDNSSATTTPKPEPTFLAKIKHFITKSMLKSTVDLDPKANIAHYAAVAQDPATRVKLSKEWLAVSLGHFYLPAALPLARLHLQQYVWTSHNLTNDLGWLGAESLDTPGVVKNPLYDVWMGAVLLGQVFAAARKIEDARHRAKTNAEFRRLAEPWAEFEEVLESYEAQLDELLDEAKEIADAVGIDVEHDHELMYRHRGERGQGVIECDEETK